MLFNYEKEMAAPVTRWLVDRGLLIKQEFQTQWGVCDIAACELDPLKVAIRIKQRQTKPLGPAGRVLLHQNLPDAEKTRRGASLEELQQYFDFSQTDKLAIELDRLVAARHATKTKSGKFLKVNGWAPLHKQLIAVELKLSRISEAIAQANSNRNFATQSYVAMPLPVAERAVSGATRELLISSNVGMIGVSPDSCTILMESQCSAALSPLYETHAVEQFWKISVPNSSA